MTNAIFLAAGLGSRCGELTKEQHKALFPIEGIPNIERNIRYLREYGVEDIYIVTGYLSEHFTYLEKKYGVKLIHNDKYREYNNIYSLFLGLEHLGDTFVIDSDVVLFRNVFRLFERSMYYTIRRNSESKEWIPVLEDNRVIRMLVSPEALPSMLGISYWTKADGEKIRTAFSAYMKKETLQNPLLYWDDIPTKMYDTLCVGTYEVSADDAAEVDTAEEYRAICEKYELYEK